MVCLCLCGCASLAAQTKVQVVLTECSPFRIHILLSQFSMSLRDSKAHLLSCFLLSLLSPILWDAVQMQCFVCLFGADCCQAKDQYIEQFKDTLSTSVAKSIAGFFAEPIQVGV